VTAADTAILISVAAGTLRAATPVAFAGLGGLISERSGVLNLSLEGLMLIGACSAVWAQQATGSSMVAVAVAALTAGAFGLLHAFFCVQLRASQVVCGLAFVFMGQGLTAIAGSRLVGELVSPSATAPLSFLLGVPILGDVVGRQDVLVLCAPLAAAGVWAFLFRTRWGVYLRACGESAKAAAASGVAVAPVRMAAGTVCGAFCGIGGAHLSLFYAQQWQENMVAGRGWIALVMVILGMWLPGRLLLSAYLFGFLMALQLNLQAAGLQVPQYLLAMMPFVATVAVLVVASWWLRRRPSWMPADLGRAYVKGD
jgi:simple sugar transport system permease protein